MWAGERLGYHVTIAWPGDGADGTITSVFMPAQASGSRVRAAGRIAAADAVIGPHAIPAGQVVLLRGMRWLPLVPRAGS